MFFKQIQQHGDNFSYLIQLMKIVMKQQLWIQALIRAK